MSIGSTFTTLRMLKDSNARSEEKARERREELREKRRERQQETRGSRVEKQTSPDDVSSEMQLVKRQLSNGQLGPELRHSYSYRDALSQMPNLDSKTVEDGYKNITLEQLTSRNENGFSLIDNPLTWKKHGSAILEELERKGEPLTADHLTQPGFEAKGINVAPLDLALGFSQGGMAGVVQHCNISANDIYNDKGAISPAFQRAFERGTSKAIRNMEAMNVGLNDLVTFETGKLTQLGMIAAEQPKNVPQLNLNNFELSGFIGAAEKNPFIISKQNNSPAFAEQFDGLKAHLKDQRQAGYEARHGKPQAKEAALSDAIAVATKALDNGVKMHDNSATPPPNNSGRQRENETITR